LAPASWNRTVATLGSFFAYTTRQGWTPVSPPPGWNGAGLAPTRAHARRRAIPEAELRAFLDSDYSLREKTLWWLLYETAARANEILDLDVEDLDFPTAAPSLSARAGQAELVAGKPRPPGCSRAFCAAAHEGRSFLADIAPAPGRQPAVADLDPHSGRPDSPTDELPSSSARPPGRTLHQLRHSRLNPPAETGVALPLLMAKSRHSSLTSLAVYAKPTFDAVAKATAAVDPHRRRR